MFVDARVKVVCSNYRPYYLIFVNRRQVQPLMPLGVAALAKLYIPGPGPGPGQDQGTMCA